MTITQARPWLTKGWHDRRAPPQTRHNWNWLAARSRAAVSIVDKLRASTADVSRVELTMIKMFLTVTVSFALASQ
jgi:hypothetical protein